MFKEVKKSSAYWNLINRAKNRSARNRTISPLKRTDGSFALMDKEKAQMMNAYFSEIGENLIKSLPMPPQPASVDASTSPYILSPKSPILITNHSVEKKVNKLKTNKSVGSDDISPKLLKLAGKAIVPALVKLRSEKG